MVMKRCAGVAVDLPWEEGNYELVRQEEKLGDECRVVKEGHWATERALAWLADSGEEPRRWDGDTIVVFPGSRREEVERNLGPQLAAARVLCAAHGMAGEGAGGQGLRVVVCPAPGRRRAVVRRAKEDGFGDLSALAAAGLTELSAGATDVGGAPAGAIEQAFAPARPADDSGTYAAGEASAVRAGVSRSFQLASIAEEGTDARYRELARARLALVCSGSATLEVAAFGVPMVITYAADRRLEREFDQLRAQGLVPPWIGLPNIVAARSVVPEVAGSDSLNGQIFSEARVLLEDAALYQVAVKGLRAVSDSTNVGEGQEVSVRLVADVLARASATGGRGQEARP
jgi:hypothetical protein